NHAAAWFTEAASLLSHRRTVPSRPHAAASPTDEALHPVAPAKLKVRTPNDEYEQETDRIDAQVTQMPDATPAMKPALILGATSRCNGSALPAWTAGCARSAGGTAA